MLTSTVLGHLGPLLDVTFMQNYCAFCIDALPGYTFLGFMNDVALFCQCLIIWTIAVLVQGNQTFALKTKCVFVICLVRYSLLENPQPPANVRSE